MSNTTVWTFQAMDTLFFRDGRPMNAGESAWVDSVFPPSGQSLQGAIRAAILDHHPDADIEKFQNNQLGQLNNEIGHGCSLGQMRLAGGFLRKGEETLFPAPLDLVRNERGEFALLRPDEKPVECDLGTVRLPYTQGTGFKPLEGQYISAATLEKLLSGDAKALDTKEIYSLIAQSREDDNALCDREPKIGLARDNESRTARESMLFAIAPVRPRPEVSIAVQVEGVSRDNQPNQPTNEFLQKLGGEGKLAQVRIDEGELDLPKGSDLTSENGRIRFKLVFVTPALLQDEDWLPKDFKKNDQAEHTRWAGAIDGCKLDVISACIGKPVKMGGWNLAMRRPEDLRAFVPAGSVYFCEADEDEKDRIAGLHECKIGERPEYGYGQVLVGTW